MKLLNVKWNKESNSLEVSDKFAMRNINGLGNCIQVKQDNLLAVSEGAFEKKRDGFVINAQCVYVEDEDVNEIKYLKKADNESDDVLVIVDLSNYPKNVLKATVKGKIQNSLHTFRVWGVKPMYNLNAAPSIYKIDKNQTLDFEGIGENNIIFSISNQGKELKIK